MHDSWAPFNCSMKGAQLGVTEVCINRAFYTLDVLKRDVLYVLPTSKTASDFSKARFGPALGLSPYVRNMFTDLNSVELKQAGSNTLYIRGSRGDSNLVSLPVSELILDEVDRMDWDKIWNAIERLGGQLQRHIWAISTPTLPGKGIHRLWKETTQEQFVFPCPRCSKHIYLSWPECIEIRGEHISDPKIRESYLKCPECQGKIEHEEKPDAFSKAYWQPFASEPDDEKRGFHINQLYSYTYQPWQLVEKYFRSYGDELATKEFWNNTLGQPFVGSGAAVNDDMLSRCVRPYTKDDPRPEVGRERIITMGVDQGKWNYVEVTEWFFDDFGLDLNVNASAKVLYEGRFLDEHFHSTLDMLMREWQVLACVIDWQPNTMDARRFARRFPGFVWLCRYGRNATAKEIAITDDDGGAPVVTVDRSNWLSAALGRFKIDPARITLPRDISKMYCDHVKNVVSTYIRDEHGNPELDFVTVEGPDDHFAHARTYSEIALPLAAARTTNQDIQRFL